MKTNILNIIIILFLFGCNSSKQKQTKIDLPIPPPPPTHISPPSEPPSFIPDLLDIKELQVNRLPHPFNLNGSLPFAVWADGKRLHLNSFQTKELAGFLGIKFEQPPNTKEIHNGEGWLRPFITPTNTYQANQPRNLPFNTEIR
jgi:hypothetical protein